MGLNKWHATIRKIVLRDAKPANDTISNGTGHKSSTDSLQSYYLDLLRITLGSNQDPYVASKGHVNRTNEIEGPSVKWPRGGDTI